VTELAPATLKQAPPVTARTVTPSPLPAAPGRISMAALHRRFAQIPTGGISGQVTDSAGHPVKNICVNVITSFGYVGTDTSAKGTFNTTTHLLPPGKYAVEFTPTCIPGEKPSGNWAPQWYRGKYSLASANKITIRAGRITRGVNAVMKAGGQVSGVVTGAGGVPLTGACVDLLTANGRDYLAQVKTARGRYRITALDPGRYRVQFSPCSPGTAKYLGQWWPAASKPQGAKAVTVRLSQVTAGIDAVLALGGTITGTVRFKNSHGRPLAGICVYGTGLGSLGSLNPSSLTGKNGSYAMDGLPTGRYSLSFGTGCKNNGNYLYQNDRHPVSVTAGATTSGVNAYLQPGGTISGTVTSAATGKPLKGICVFINAGFGGARTSKTGAFRMDQLEPGRYSVEFDGGCGNSGSYAPQWYPGRTKQVNAALVTIRADRVTSGIDAAMQPGATVTGTVANTSGKALSGICVMAADAATAGFLEETGMFAQDAQTGSSGTYRIANLAAGQYQVAFFSCGFNTGPGYVAQWFPTQRSEAAAGMLDIAAAANVTGLDAAMTRGGAISGTLKGAGFTGQFLDICITAINRATHVSTQSESLSNTATVPYAIGGLAAGRYSVAFSDCGGTGYATQWYRGKTAAGSANPVTVKAGHTTRSVGAVLRKPGNGSIAGRVIVKETGKPGNGICVAAFSPSGEGGTKATPSGDYIIRRLPAGRYRLSFGGCAGHNPYAIQTRPGSVQVTPTRSVTGVDFAVSFGGSISGRVLGGSPAVPEPGVCVEAVPKARGADDGFAQTGLGGRYTITGLLAGRYLVQFSDVLCTDSAEGLAPQWYSGQYSQASATPVTVRAGAATTRVGGTLPRDGSITGTVTGPAPASRPLSGICVQAVPVVSGAGTLDQINPVATVTQAGSYTLAGVIPGQYRVEFSSGCEATGYADQWWENAASRASATIITVSPATTTTSINAAMGS
jgi:hypothetical protein